MYMRCCKLQQSFHDFCRLLISKTLNLVLKKLQEEASFPVAKKSSYNCWLFYAGKCSNARWGHQSWCNLFMIILSANLCFSPAVRFDRCQANHGRWSCHLGHAHTTKKSGTSYKNGENNVLFKCWGEMIMTKFVGNPLERRHPFSVWKQWS